jgi:diguanylate cyclase (GGDEF)-like protein
MRLSIQRKLLYSHFLAVLLVSGSIGTLFYRVAIDSLKQSLRSRLMNSAALLSRSLDARELEAIRGPDDVGSPAYASVLAQLREFQGSNQDIAFIYVMRLDGDVVRFVLDSDSSSEQAQPGDDYSEDAPRLREGFTRLAADDEITADRWGHFLSGYAPLKNGAGRYLVGLDMRADEVDRKLRGLRLAGLGSLVLSVLLAYMFSAFLARRIVEPLRRVAARSEEIARGELAGDVEIATGDELGELTRAFNTMSARLRESHERTQRALAELEEARDSLEHRVSERTASLAEMNQRLTQEIAERERAEEALARAATTDYLTGLVNRRAMLQRLEQEHERVRRGGNPSVVLLADLDHFKRVNDEHGHEVGDHALIAVATALRALVRRQDVVSRWGGEEMLVLLPDTDREGALEVAEKIRAAFAAAPRAVLGRDLRLTWSIGVAEITAGASVADTVRRADRALYRAKEAGRDRVESAPEGGV